MEQQERRTARPGTRAARVAGGTGGAAVAVIVAWTYQEYTGRTMTPEVAAALGGLISTFAICYYDLRALVFMLVDRRSKQASRLSEE